MATYKRRIVYLSDQEWTDLAEAAHREGQTISAFLRDAISDEARTTAIVKDVAPLIGIEDRFNSRPFTPVPKKGRGSQA